MIAVALILLAVLALGGGVLLAAVAHALGEDEAQFRGSEGEPGSVDDREAERIPAAGIADIDLVFAEGRTA